MQRFRTTRWSLVLETRGEGAAAALETLCRIYRPPVLAAVRRRGYADAEAEDLTQAFFEQLLRLGTWRRADPALGRFRVFLQVALKRFLSNHLAASAAAKRGGGRAAVSLDESLVDPALASTDPGPDAAFELEWAQAVLREALLGLRAEAEAAGKLPLFRALQPFLLEAPDADDYARVADGLGMRRNTVAVAIHRLRERLRQRVRDELAETVQASSELDAEVSLLQQRLDESQRMVVGPPGRADPARDDVPPS